MRFIDKERIEPSSSKVSPASLLSALSSRSSFSSQACFFFSTCLISRLLSRRWKASYRSAAPRIGHLIARKLRLIVRRQANLGKTGVGHDDAVQAPDVTLAVKSLRLLADKSSLLATSRLALG